LAANRERVGLTFSSCCRRSTNVVPVLRPPIALDAAALPLLGHPGDPDYFLPGYEPCTGGLTEVPMLRLIAVTVLLASGVASPGSVAHAQEARVPCARRQRGRRPRGAPHTEADRPHPAREAERGRVQRGRRLRCDLRAPAPGARDFRDARMGRDDARGA